MPIVTESSSTAEFTVPTREKELPLVIIDGYDTFDETVNSDAIFDTLNFFLITDLLYPSVSLT